MSILLAEMDLLIRRYPSQDQEESIETYQQDLESLALRYSLAEVKAALAEWRITPGAQFFPRPDEIAETLMCGREAARRAREAEARNARRAAEIEKFWNWAPWWMEQTGNDEAELLNRFPSYKGTKTDAR